jgi:hypothetical protein
VIGDPSILIVIRKGPALTRVLSTFVFRVDENVVRRNGIVHWWIPQVELLTIQSGQFPDESVRITV